MNDFDVPTPFKRRTRWMNFKRSVKFFFQRLFRGFDDSETWGLDGEIARLILPRLRRFKELTQCYPDGVCNDHGITHIGSMDDWQKILDEMIFAFEYYDSDARFDGASAETYARVQNGLKLFAVHYGCLWW